MVVNKENCTAKVEPLFHFGTETLNVPPAGSRLGVADCGCSCCSCCGGDVACEAPPPQPIPDTTNSPELGDDRTGDGHRRKSHCKHSGERKLQIPNAGGLLHANGDSHRDRGGIKQVVAVERDLVDAGCELAGARYVNLLTTDHS